MATTGILATAAAALAIASTAVEAQDVRTGYIAANGVDYYYEIRGKGEPLLLLHGGLGSTDMFGPVLPQLADHRQVIAVDLQGHGRTALGDRPFSLQAMGDDMAVMLKSSATSRSTSWATRWAAVSRSSSRSSSRETVRRLVLVSAGYSQDGFYPEMLPMQAQVGAAMAELDEGHADVQVLRGRRA